MTRPTRVTRRGFLKAAAVAAAASPYVVPASSFSANDRTTAGIIGLGGPAGGGGGGTQLVAVCDVRQDKLDRHKNNTSVQQYRDFRDLLERDDIDAVFIGTPDP